MLAPDMAPTGQATLHMPQATHFSWSKVTSIVPLSMLSASTRQTEVQAPQSMHRSSSV